MMLLRVYCIDNGHIEACIRFLSNYHQISLASKIMTRSNDDVVSQYKPNRLAWVSVYVIVKMLKLR
jgi:hypothetical protein